MTQQKGVSHKILNAFLRYIPQITSDIGRTYTPITKECEATDTGIKFTLEFNSDDYNHISTRDDLKQFTISGIRNKKTITKFERLDFMPNGNLFVIKLENTNLISRPNGTKITVGGIDGYNGVYTKINSISGDVIFRFEGTAVGNIPSTLGFAFFDTIYYLNDIYEITIGEENKIIIDIEIDQYDNYIDDIFFDNIKLSYLYSNILAQSANRWFENITASDIDAIDAGTSFIVIDPDTFNTSESKDSKNDTDSSYNQQSMNASYWKNASISIYFINRNCDSVDYEAQKNDILLSSVFQILDNNIDGLTTFINAKSNTISTITSQTGTSYTCTQYTVQFRVRYDYISNGLQLQERSYKIDKVMINDWELSFDNA